MGLVKAKILPSDNLNNIIGFHDKILIDQNVTGVELVIISC